MRRSSERTAGEQVTCFRIISGVELLYDELLAYLGEATGSQHVRARLIIVLKVYFTHLRTPLGKNSNSMNSCPNLPLWPV